MALVSASFAGLKERDKRRRSDKLGTFIEQALQLSRDCEDSTVPFATTNKKCDALQRAMNEYVRTQFGPGAVAHLTNSHGVSIEGSYYTATEDAVARQPMANWCRYRAARLSELIGGLHVG